MKHNRCYNLESAKELCDIFLNKVNVNIFEKSRETRIVTLRTLFFKILFDLNYMNDRQISDFLKTKGLDMDRSSIYHALKKIDLYYNNYYYFRNAYDIYFDDKKEERLKKERKRSLEAIKLKISSNIFEEKDNLTRLIETIPGEKREEIYELVKLRIKSWSWKSKDKCKTFNSSESISEFVY